MNMSEIQPIAGINAHIAPIQIRRTKHHAATSESSAKWNQRIAFTTMRPLEMYPSGVYA